MSYGDRKRAIDEDGESVRMVNTSRGEQLGGHIEMLDVGRYKVYPTEGAGETRSIEEEQSKLVAEFAVSLKKTKFRVASFKQINQYGELACTIAALFHLVHLDKDAFKIFGRSWYRSRPRKAAINAGKNPYWKTCWERVKAQRERPRYFADTLDAGIAAGIDVFTALRDHPRFRYLPVKGDADRELNTNKILLTQAATRGAEQRFGEAVSENPVTCAVGHFLESKLDEGVPVGVAYNGHARVIVAYNDTHLLMADSWGDVIMRDAATDEYYVAGVSRTPKFGVYKFCKDLVYFERSALLDVTNMMQRLSSGEIDEEDSSAPSAEDAAEALQAQFEMLRF